jgi:WD40 repeat protein
MGMSANGLAVIATVKGVVTARDGAILSSLELGSATAAAVTGDGCVAAVGCEDGRIHMFAVAATGELQPHAILVKHRGAVTALAFSNSDRMLASGDANREVLIWEECEKTWAVKVSGMVYHTARVTCLSWAPDGQRLASGGASVMHCTVYCWSRMIAAIADARHAFLPGVDCNIIIWNLAEPASKRVTMAGAHRDGVSALCWLSSGSLLSAGADACVRVWV